MHIGIVVESFPVLSETFISNKVKYFTEHGHSIVVFCGHANNILFESLFKNNKSVKIVLLNKKKFISYFLFHPWLIFEIRKQSISFKKELFATYKIKILNRNKCDIIHFEFSGIAVSYLECIDSLKCRTVVSCRGSAENVNLSLYSSRQKHIQQLFSKINSVHCVSLALREVIKPYCEVPEKIFINEPGIDVNFFSQKNKKYQTDVPVILSIGRFIFQKGYLTGMLAIKKLKEHTSNFKWIIVGGGNQYEELFFYINQLNLEENVVLENKKTKEEILDLYSEASIFFLPSVTEGIANVALEAMSMGLAVVATKSGGMEEVIENNVSGLLSDIYDDDDLAKNILLLLKEKKFCDKISVTAEKKAKKKFSIESRIAKFEEVYFSLLH